MQGHQHSYLTRITGDVKRLLRIFIINVCLFHTTLYATGVLASDSPSARSFNKPVLTTTQANTQFATESPFVSPTRPKMPPLIQEGTQFSPFRESLKTQIPINKVQQQFESEDISTQRMLYSNALKALKKGDRKTFLASQAKLRDYPLYPYLRYYELAQTIPSQTTEDIKQFMANNPTLPVTAFLKSRKLYSLAQTKQWPSFKNFYTTSQDPQLICYYQQSLLETGHSTQAYANLQDMWLSGTPQPANCDPLFTRWMSSNAFKPEYTWKRYVRALELNNPTLAKYLIKHLPPAQQSLAKQGLDFYRLPERLLCCNLGQQNAATGDISYIALMRLANKDPELAMSLWPKLNQTYHYDERRRTAFQEQVAIILAVRFHPLAEKWLIAANPLRSNTLLNELEIRVALRKLDWKKAHEKIKTLPDSEFRTDRWQYWYARTLSNVTSNLPHKNTYRILSEKQNFYGILAREGQPATRLQTLQYHISETDQASITSHSNIRRAYEFYVLGQQANARREWQFAMPHLNEKQRFIAAELANTLNWSSLTIRAANAIISDKYVALKYPTGFKNEIVTYANKNNLHQDLVFALIRQESLFTPDVQSPVGAVGVMQIMPATATLLARKHNIPYNGPNDLLNPEKNIRLGTIYLKDLLGDFNGDEIKTMASYNAGPGSVTKWLTETPLPLDIWIETMPYKETRNYVKQILNNQDIYRRKLGLKPRPLPTHIGS